MKAPISEKAQEFLKDRGRARSLAEAIRKARTRGETEVTVPLDGEVLSVHEVGESSIHVLPRRS